MVDLNTVILAYRAADRFLKLGASDHGVVPVKDVACMMETVSRFIENKTDIQEVLLATRAAFLTALTRSYADPQTHGYGLIAATIVAAAVGLNTYGLIEVAWADNPLKGD